MCSLRDRWPEIQEKAKVYGISYDGQSALAKFRESQHLPFSLLSDADKAVAKAYGVSGMVAAARVSFVLTKDGVIHKVIEDVNMGEHDKQVLDALP
jgi:thioredoxin-dependent peroxiredoxin